MMSIRSGNAGKALPALTAGMFFWACSFVALKWAFQGFNPYAVVFWRMVAGSLFGLFLWWKLRLPLPGRSDWAPLLLMSFFEPGLFFIFHTEALLRTTASQAGVVAALMPLLAAAGARIFLRERISLGVSAGLTLSLTGAIMLSLSAESSAYAPAPSLGNLLELAAMACAAGYTIMVGRLSRNYNAIFLTVFQVVFGALFFAVVLLFAPPAVPAERLFSFAAVVVFLGVFSTFGAYGLYNYGISRLAVGIAAPFVTLIPVFTLILGVVLLGEDVSLNQILSMSLVIAGLLTAGRQA